MGADVVVDHTGDLASLVRDVEPKGVDCAIHLAGDGAALAELVVAGGRIVSTLGLGPDAVGGRDVQATPVMTIPNSVTLGQLAEAVVRKELRVPITRTYAFDQAPEALKDFGQGALGKLAITV
jgi:NADPH:quinone reductase-like Zn-dependent oxidoreductase